MQLNYRLTEASLRLRQSCEVTRKAPFILDIDATTNEQHGQKIEEVGYDHDRKFGLSTVQAHDQFGFQYWHWVREGGTFAELHVV